MTYTWSARHRKYPHSGTSTRAMPVRDGTRAQRVVADYLSAAGLGMVFILSM